MSLILDKINYVYSEGTAYQIQALKDVNLEIKDGQFIGVIGHTGSGKSTLIQHLNGLVKATSGTIYFNGQDIYDEDFDLRELRNRVGLVFQYPEHQLFETTIFDDVCFGPKNQGLSKEEAGLRAFEALRSVGLPEELYYQSPFDLSGGQKRRGAIAGVLAMKPEVLILDEPTVGLDPKQIIEIRDLIKELGKKHTIILSSHILSEISAVCDHVFIISHGKLVASDSTENLLERMTGAQEIELLVKAEEDTAETAIREVAQVERCEKTESKEDGAVQLLVTAKKDADVREAIYHTCVEHHMPILVMKAASKSLEDVFLELTSQEGGTK